MLVWDIKYSLLPFLVLHLLSFMFSNTLLSLPLLFLGMLTSFSNLNFTLNVSQEEEGILTSILWLFRSICQVQW